MSNKLSTELNIDWEFDIESDDVLHREFGLESEDVAAILSNAYKQLEFYEKVCEHYGLPHYVDMSEYFDDPHSTSSSQIIETLSDKFGWMIRDFKWLEACN